MRLTCSILAFSVALVVVNSLETVRAATFNANIGGQNYTIVEVDPFPNGGPSGNTVRESGGGYWSDTAAQTGDIWNQRAYSAFNTGYVSLAGATDRVFENSNFINATAVRTTVSGLPANNYAVFLLYTHNPGLVSSGHPLGVGTQAALNDLAANGSYFGTPQAIANVSGSAGTWFTGIAPLGTTGPGATSFFVDMDEFGSAADPNNNNDAPAERNHLLAIAYQVAPIPEPASAVMAVLGAAGCLRVLRRRRK